jgi:hypothetical protein
MDEAKVLEGARELRSLYEQLREAEIYAARAIKVVEELRRKIQETKHKHCKIIAESGGEAADAAGRKGE